MTVQATKTAFSPVEPRLSEAKFLGLVNQLPDWTLEYSAEGILTFMPPTDPITSRRNSLITHRLTAWAEKVGTGMVSGPDGGFLLPDGSRLSPDAAFFSEARWNAAQVPGVRFPVFVPEFVIELRSPTDRRRNLEEKMENWIANGVQIGWLVDPLERTVSIYRANHPCETISNPAQVNGDAPVAGFVLPLASIFPPEIS